MTILEAARRLNVSKTTIRNYMNDDFKAKYCSKRPNGAINISAQGFLELSTKIEVESSTTNDQKECKTTDRQNRPAVDMSPIVEFLQAQISAMNEQIAKKDEQIAQKDEQIKALQEQNSQLTTTIRIAQENLQASQLLHAADKPQLLEQNNEPAPEVEKKPKKKHWWQPKE